jgi:hypothetical protein
VRETDRQTDTDRKTNERRERERERERERQTVTQRKFTLIPFPDKFYKLTQNWNKNTY